MAPHPAADPTSADRGRYRLPRLALLLATALFAAAPSGPAPRPDDGPPAAMPNDNRRAAGTRHGDTLELHLEVRRARWRPEGDSGGYLDVAAFGEAGGPPQIPGPLIRVPAGTIVVASVRNRLADSTIAVHGLLAHPAAHDDSLLLRPGDSTTVTFSAGAAGTYLYRAVLGRHSLLRNTDDEQETASGAFVVDPPGGSPPDRILVLNIWGIGIHAPTYRNALAINGRSWPTTERIEATVGDSIRWRVLNASIRIHPMHLHGFYFRVDALGDGIRDVASPLDARPLAVTQSMLPFQTLAMTWSPDRPGDWLYHCHVGYHVVPSARMDPPAALSHDRMAHDPTVHMAGLVLGIHVAPRGTEPPRGPARRLHLFVQEGTPRGRAPRALGFVLQRDRRAPARDSLELPGSPLLLTRDQPTDVVVVNRLAEPAAIHWHGIELESFSDGVAGWSGAGNRLAPSIMPGDSFVAHLTLPRAGTFMYHTHMNDIEQLTSGLYGAILVLEPGQQFDPRHDHLFVLGWDGEDKSPPHVLVNGDSLPGPLELAAGLVHRLRLVNIGVGGRFRWAVWRDSTLTRWRPLARDGADLPATLAVTQPSAEWIDVGETRDMEFRPEPGEYRLTISNPAQTLWSQVIRVR